MKLFVFSLITVLCFSTLGCSDSNNANSSTADYEKSPMSKKESGDDGNESADNANETNEDNSKPTDGPVDDKPIHLTKAEFIEQVWDYEANPDEFKFKGDLPCIIDFYADWCGPCRRAAPVLDNLAKEYAGKIRIYKIDTDKETELAQVFGIKGIPAFLYCPMKGKPQMTSGVGRTDEETKQMFVRMINSVLLTK